MIFRRKFRSIVLLLIPITLSLHSCMYSFKGNLPPHLESIAIPLFENQTAEYQVNETITDLLVQQFMEEAVLEVEDEDRADSILEGTVTRIDDTPYTYDAAEQVEEYRVDITLRVQWYDAVQEEVRLEQSISGWGTYSAQEATVARQDGIAEAIDMIADKIINAITANW